MKVYVVTNYSNGEDFDGTTSIVGVFAKKSNALKAFRAEVKNWKAYSKGNAYEDDRDDTSYVITDFDADYNAEVRIHESELK